MKRKHKQRTPKPATISDDLPQIAPPAVKGGRGFLPRAWNRGWLPGALLMAVTLFAYWPALRGGFIWDDDSWTTGIQGLLKNAAGLGSIWLRPTVLQQYYPLTATTFWADYHLWGFWTTPYHVENVLLHGLAAVLFWRLLRWLEVPGAWLAAWVMALHPLMVESAAWITERKNVLSMVFYLGALLAYGKYAGFWREQDEQPRQRGPYLLAWMLLLGALLAKTTAFSLPPVLLVLCWWKRGQLRWRADILPTLPFFALALGLSLVTAWMEKHHVGSHGPEWALSFGQRCLVAGRALWFYAAKLIWPAELCFVYPRWEPDVHSLVQWFYPAAALGVLAGLWLGRKRLGRGPAAAAFIFAGALLPLLGFINGYFMRYSFVCDHWAYLSDLALITLGVAGMVLVAERLKLQQWLPATGMALLLVLGVLTWRQCGMYRDVETLWRTTLAINPKSDLANYDLGYYLQNAGRTDEAMICYQKALEYLPNFAEAHTGIAAILFQEGKFDEAQSHYQKALEIDPARPLAQNNLGAALLQLGRVDEAIPHFERALELQPDYAEARNNLGEALFQGGRPDQAMVQFQRALEINPDFEQAHNNLGLALLSKGRVDDAIGHFQKALELQPRYAKAEANLGLALLRKGRVDDAIGHLQKALALQPGNRTALENLGRVAWVLATCPDPAVRNGAKATELAQEADRLSSGGNPVAIGTLAAAYAETGRFAEAVSAAQRALQVANGRNNPALTAALQTQLEAYQANRPYRDTNLAGGSIPR